jgi:hypothetical protein
MDWMALRAHVEEHPHALLKQRAAVFNVSVNSIWYAMHQMEKERRRATRVSKESGYQTSSEDRTIRLLSFLDPFQVWESRCLPLSC